MVAIRQQPKLIRATISEEQAFTDSVLACRGTLYAAALAILRNEADAQDAVQDAILRAWKALPSLKEPRYFTTWMTRITIRTAITLSKKRKPTQPLLMELPAEGSNLAEKLDIQRAIGALDEKTRLVTVLFYFEDMSVEEIARATGIFTGTVKSRLFRARGKLREILEGYNHDK